MSKQLIVDTIDGFNAISLQDLNNRAALLNRSDNKYVLNNEQLLQMLQYCKPDYEVLEIDGIRQFEYSNLYFDSNGLQTFLDHNQGRRNRIKIRVRSYIDAKLNFFEVKLKGLRGRTHKYRLKISPQIIDNKTLGEQELSFLQTKYQKHYNRPWQHKLRYALTLNYKRITLVTKENSERITIDNDINFFDNESHDKLPENRWIIEVKSEKGRSLVDKWLLQNSLRPVSKCAKYSMAVSLLKYPHNNRFRPVLKKQFDLAVA